MGCPSVALKTKGFGSTGDQLGQLRKLLIRQRCASARCRLMSQRINAAAIPNPLKPLTHCALCYSQRGSDLSL